MGRYRLWTLLGLACSIASCPGCTNSGPNSSGTPPLSASDKAKMAEMSKQNDITLKEVQINRSNLPPEQKQRLLDQLHGGEHK